MSKILKFILTIRPFNISARAQRVSSVKHIWQKKNTFCVLNIFQLCNAVDCVLIFLGASACTAPKFYIFTEANFYHTGAFQTIHPHKYKLCIIHHRWPLISCCKVWTTGTQLYEPFSKCLWRKVFLLHGGMTLEETLQTMFCELKSSLCVGLNVRQSSPVL